MNQPAREIATSKGAVVVYSTRYGNTKKIAESLELGLREARIQTACVNTCFAVLVSLGALTIGASVDASVRIFLSGVACLWSSIF